MGCEKPKWEKHVEEIVSEKYGTIMRITFRRVRQPGLVMADPPNPCDGYLQVPEEVPPGSVFIASGTGEGYWLAPGDEGDYMRTINGLMCWVP